MRLKHNIPIFLIVLLFLVLVGFLTQKDFLGKLSFPKQLVTPSVAPAADFVVDIPQKALLKNYVVISAQTAPGTNCELVFIPPSGEIQKMDAEADDNGRCVWRWKLEESLGKGHGRLIFTIGGKSETHFIEIRSNF